MSIKDNTRPKLILFCGLPGSGKTTLARKLAQETPAIRLNTDEWMADLGFDPQDEKMHVKVQQRLWELAKELLYLGQDVILENGLWTRSERDEKRREAQELNVRTELHYLDVPIDELARRLKSRQDAHGVAKITQEQIEEYAKVFQAPDNAELALFSHHIIHKS